MLKSTHVKKCGKNVETEKKLNFERNRFDRKFILQSQKHTKLLALAARVKTEVL